MIKATSNDIEVLMAANCSNSSMKVKKKYETTHLEQSNNKSSCRNKQLCDFIEISRNNSLKFREQLKTSKDIAQLG